MKVDNFPDKAFQHLGKENNLTDDGHLVECANTELLNAKFDRKQLCHLPGRNDFRSETMRCMLNLYVICRKEE